MENSLNIGNFIVAKNQGENVEGVEGRLLHDIAISIGVHRR
jgi:hypothetical protein